MPFELLEIPNCKKYCKNRSKAEQQNSEMGPVLCTLNFQISFTTNILELQFIYSDLA